MVTAGSGCGLGSTDLARQVGLPAHVLRRELQMMEVAELVRFQRVGPSRLVAPGQLNMVLSWLRRRGLLPTDSAQQTATA